MEATFLNLIPESKLKQLLQESAKHSGISLLLYDKFGQLIIQYPHRPQQAFDVKEVSRQIRDTDLFASGHAQAGEIVSFEISNDLGLFSQPIFHDNQLIARLAAISSHSEECRNIVHITKRRIEDIIALNAEIESLSKEIIENYDELNLLYTSSEMLAGINNIEGASSKIIQNAIDVIKADYGSILLADEDKEELYVAYTHGEGYFYNQRIKFSDGVCGLVATQRKPILIESKDNLPKECCEPLLFNPPLIACPMIAKGKLIGVIILARESKDDVFTAMNLKLLNAIASQAAIAFINVKLFNDLMESNQQLKDTLKHPQTTQEQFIQSQRLVAMGQLVASVAHDINNPLTGIIGYTELLLMNKELSGEFRDELKVIHKEAQRAAGIVRSLQTFVKNRSHEKRPVNLNHVIHETLRIIEEEFAKKNIQIITDLEKNLPTTIADSGQIQQVLMNLLMNAAEAMNDSGRIEIKTEIPDERLSNRQKIRFSVSDNGHGVPKDVLGKIFEPFFTTKDDVKNTGLGLSICHSIVAAHGGRIYVESEIGKGTTFFVELPILKQDIKPNFNPLIKSSFTRKPKGEQILVVDDELLVQDLLVNILKSEGYLVDVASDGEEALSKLEGGQYDLLIIDIIMPKIDGIELYNRITQKSPDSELKNKVIFITGDTLREDTKLFLKQNEANYISKPFNRANLCRKINEVLASRG